jgi:BTB/POZ domain
MSATETSDHDYSTGLPRRHHSLYIDDGNLVFQVNGLGFIVDITDLGFKVENAIFKVHRSFLVKSSTVIKDMFDVTQPGETGETTNARPLVLAGDKASAWELLLESHYERYSGRKCLSFAI